jgi:hypothetical protein
VKIAGHAKGGTVTIGSVGDPDNVITVETVAGETPTQIMTKLVEASDSSPTFHRAALTTDGLAIEFFNSGYGSFFVRTTDNGVESVPCISSLTAHPSKADGQVTLSWVLPDPAPDRIVIRRNARRFGFARGTASSFIDTKFNQAKPASGSKVSYILLCVKDGDPPMYSDIVRITTDNPEYMPDDQFQVLTGGPTSLGLPDGVKDSAYSAALDKSGGTDPVSWSVSDGSLPDGITLDALGVFGGTPTAAGQWVFTAMVTDAVGATASRSLTVVVTEFPVLTDTVNE